jgi:hypothetical protein
VEVQERRSGLAGTLADLALTRSLGDAQEQPDE